VIRRRFAAVLSALAVVTSGLVWSASPANAIETISVAPSNYTDAAQPLNVTVNGFPTMATSLYYVFWLDFVNMTGTNTGNSCPTFTLVGGSGTPLPNGAPGSNSSNPTIPPCTWVSGTKFRFVYADATGLNSTSQVQISFPANSFSLPASGEYGVVFTAGLTQQFPLDSACLGNCPNAGAPITRITIDIDPNGGECTVERVTGFQGTWTLAPGAGVAAGQPGAGTCRKAGATFVGFSTNANGSGLAIAPGGNLQLTGDNRLYAQYQEARPAGAPSNVRAVGGLRVVDVSWTAPRDAGTSPITNYLAQASNGSVCIARLSDATPLTCRFTNLTPGQEYTYRVQALNSAGWGEFSTPSPAAGPYNLVLDVVDRSADGFFQGGGSTLAASGRTPGLKPGTELIPQLRIGSGQWASDRGSIPKVDKNGRFSWSKKFGKDINNQPVSVRFAYDGGTTPELTANRGQSIGLPSAPRDVKVTSGVDGVTVSWKPPAKDGGSPITVYQMTSDLRAPNTSRTQFVSCEIRPPSTSCTLRAGVASFDPKKTYTFSVTAKSARGTGPQAQAKWQGQLFSLNIFSKQQSGSEVTLRFNAQGWPCTRQAFDVEAKVGANGAWKKQPRAARSGPAGQNGCAAGEWTGELPKSAPVGFGVTYRLNSPRGVSNETVIRVRG